MRRLFSSARKAASDSDDPVWLRISPQTVEARTPQRAKLLKPTVILRELLEPGDDGWLIYCDADCRWKACPPFAESLGRELANHWPVLATIIDDPVRRFHRLWPAFSAEVIPAVLIFRRGDADAVSLVRLWQDLCDQDPADHPDAGDQEHLQEALRKTGLWDSRTPGARPDGRCMGWLSPEWCWIDGLSRSRYGSSCPFITHPAPRHAGRPHAD